MKATLEFDRIVNIDFETIKADPLIIIQNLPRVDYIERLSEFDFRVYLKKVPLHRGIVVSPIGHINLQIHPNEIIWTKSTEHCDIQCNGLIEGSATPVDGNATAIRGTITMKHRLINTMTWPFAKGYIQTVGHRLVDEFCDNFYGEEIK